MEEKCLLLWVFFFFSVKVALAYWSFVGITDKQILGFIVSKNSFKWNVDRIILPAVLKAKLRN